LLKARAFKTLLVHRATLTLLNFIPKRDRSKTARGYRAKPQNHPSASFSSWSDRIDEKCLHAGPIYAEKRLALWRTADIK
jgi:hypothetical protein